MALIKQEADPKPMLIDAEGFRLIMDPTEVSAEVCPA